MPFVENSILKSCDPAFAILNFFYGSYKLQFKNVVVTLR